jgi:hypothetical protein
MNMIKAKVIWFAQPIGETYTVPHDHLLSICHELPGEELVDVIT